VREAEKERVAVVQTGSDKTVDKDYGQCLTWLFLNFKNTKS